MKNLILIRHAKSSWDTSLNDYERPLSVRGIQDAHIVSEQLMEELPKSFVVWTSAATRAYNTAVIFCQNMNIVLDNIVVKKELYTFEANDLEKQIKKCDNSHQSLILFGHNDAITDFVNKFGDRTLENVPTSGVVMMQFDQDCWTDLTKGRIVKAFYPRDYKYDSDSR